METKQDRIARTERIWRLRQQVRTLQQVGDIVGITRQGVQETLARHYGSTAVSGFWTTADVARITGCSESSINRWRELGIIKPIGKTRSFLYATEVLQAIQKKKQCKLCDNDVPNLLYDYCSPVCAQEARKQAHITGQLRRRYRNTGEPMPAWLAYKEPNRSPYYRKQENKPNG